MNLLYLTFGPNIKNHYQANFSILSFLKHKNEIGAIYIFTDHPEFYAHYKAYVTVVTVTEAQLKEWKGKYDFFWRIKIKAIESVIRQHPDQPLVYLDSDTFLYQDMAGIKKLLSSNVASMHVQEGKLSELRSKTEKKMWAQVKDMPVGSMRIEAKHAMWNAGVVAIPAEKNVEAVALALEICDTLCRQKVTRRLIEQFALSVALQETYTLQPADSWIGHYWGNKDEWNDQIAAFFLESFLKHHTMVQEIECLKTFDFRKLAMVKREKKTRQRLIRLVDNLFPLKGTLFLGEGKQESD